MNLVPQIQAGTIKAYAVAMPERSPAIPQLPTIREAGLPAYQVSAWNAVFAPKGTPPEVVAKLADAPSRALDDATPASACWTSGPTSPTRPGAAPRRCRGW